MTSPSSHSHIPATDAKATRGTPLQSFGRKEQGIWVHRKDILISAFLLIFTLTTIDEVITSIRFLGTDSYFRENWQQIIRLLLALALLGYRIRHLCNALATKGEIFAQGMSLKYHSQTYTYAFTDIQHLQKTFIRGSNHTIQTVILTLWLPSGEKITINGSGNEIIIPFADALSLAYAHFKEQNVIAQFQKGKKIGFGWVELDTNALYFKDQTFPWEEISEIKKARADRYLLIMDHNGKKLAKLDLNKILDEDLFAMLLEVAGKGIG